ncbi:chain length determinant protein [Paraprevotella xylaniphila YIT 11841]|uniref:non-specific protein-tyrosine kinase n=1 Tax=Paraprevotella xylaniphila YIT 11841 TaxID=762982 RepID=F3QYS8_9BACT|nr:polysaccharide biosynthesis tyrosine autokinase [Paraprevotella xylaniphila]EGG50347.1 chain length determinant protein [Paraprevotella xylaniphila YIT 11841]
MPQKTFQTNDVVEEQDSGFNYREILDAVILHWHWFAISIIGCLFVAFLYLRCKSPVYSTWAEVLIKEDDPYKRRMSGGGLADFTQLGVLTNSNGFDNEVEILGSKTLARRAVTNLKLYVRYSFDGMLRDEELYRTSPIVADMSPVDLDTLSMPVSLVITPLQEGGYHIEGEALRERFESNVKGFPVRVKTLSGWVTLRPNPNFAGASDGRTLRIGIFRPAIMAEAFLGATSIEPISKMTTIARITMSDTQRQRAEDYMNELIRVYNEDANEVKNEVALKTEAFVNKRIKIIDAELGTTESDLELYKKRNQLVDLMSDAEAAYKGLENYQTQQIELQTQMLLVKSLKEYVDNPANYMEIIPANLGLTDESLNSMIAGYNAKVVERKRLLKTAPESSPVVVSITNAISSLYPGIRHSLSTVYDNMRVQKRHVDEQYDLFIGRLSDAPTQERVLTDIGRQQSVKAALYQILLQKREENAISLASTVDKAQVIDAPESTIRPISPKKKMVALIALVLGVAIPAGLIYLLNLLRYRIEGRNDIEKLTDLAVLSDIFVAGDLKDGKRAIVVRENSNDIMEETFRSLRTNLGFVMKKSEKVLLCTSVIPSEGKTFVSTNLAMSMALMGRKVLVVGLDVRKPRLAKLFGLVTGHHGLTTYLAGEDSSDGFLREQIFNSGMHANLDVLPAGLIPPNPGELITSERLDGAFARFREWYDMVIVDTPPVGLVSDTLLLGRLADATLIVCRCDYSLKRNFNIVNTIHQEGKLPKMNLVLNGVDLQQRKYGYYYGYGNYGRYGRYGSYGSYGGYGNYGGYGKEARSGKSKSPREGGSYLHEEDFEDKD